MNVAELETKLYKIADEIFLLPLVGPEMVHSPASIGKSKLFGKRRERLMQEALERIFDEYGLPVRLREHYHIKVMKHVIGLIKGNRTA